MRKTTTNVRIKDADQGIVEAVFSTLGVIDKDGDVTEKGAFTDGAPVVLSAYGHKSWEGALPYGHGTIKEVGDDVICEAQFMLDTSHGRDAFLVVKALSEVGLQEWSYSLEDVVAERGKVDGKNVRIIKKVRVKEVSPVLEGAGVNTRTLSAKAAGVKTLNSTLSRTLRDAAVERWGGDSTWVYPQDFDEAAGFAVFCIYSDDEADRYVQVDFTDADGSITLGDTETDVELVTAYAPKGASFSEHATAVLASVDALTARAQEVVALRAEKGKTISESSAGLLVQLDERLDALKGVIDRPVPTPPVDDELTRMWLHAVARDQGVTIQ